MRKRLTACLIAVGAVAIVAAPAAGAGEPGTIEGRILDATCFGPCQIDMEPVAYTGEATVVVRRLQHRRPVRALIPDPDGTFELRLPRGRYAFRILIEDPCFAEDRRVLRVSAGGDVDRPELVVFNDCIQ